MKLTVLQLLKALTPLKKVASADLPIAMALQVEDVVDKLNKVLTAFDKRRESAKEKFCKTAESDDPEKAKKELEEFNLAVDEIAEEKVKIDIKPILLTDLEGVSMSSEEAGLIRWLIEAPD